MYGVMYFKSGGMWVGTHVEITVASRSRLGTISVVILLLHVTGTRSWACRPQ